MKGQKKKQNGITLIALVISIIVMLILAGVSLNMTIGDNGIIKQAQNASYEMGMAALEEWLQQEYVTQYDNITDSDEGNKIAFLNRMFNYTLLLKDGSRDYIINEGKVYYLLNKSCKYIPKEVKDGLLGGDTTEYSKYTRLEDVYGVTKDLKVYYCGTGVEGAIGTIENYDIDPNASATGINGDSNLKTAISDILQTEYGISVDNEKGITLSNVSALKNLEIDGLKYPGITNISGLGDLKNLKTLTLTNMTLTSLDGLQGIPNLFYLYLNNSTSEDFNALTSSVNLQYLYIYLSPSIEKSIANGQIIKLGEGLKNASGLNKLEYMGVSGITLLYDDTKSKDFHNPTASSSSYNKLNHTDSNRSNVTTLGNGNKDLGEITGFGLFNETIKKGLKYLYLNNNSLTDISALKDFNNLIELELFCNSDLSSIGALSNHSTINYLTLHSCGLTSVSNLTGLSNLYYLSLQGNSSLASLDGLEDSNKLLMLSASNCALTDLSALAGKPSLYLIDFRKNTTLVNVEPIKNCTGLTALYLNDCEAMNSDNLKTALNTTFSKTDSNGNTETVTIFSQTNGLAGLPKKYWIYFESLASVLDYSYTTYGQYLEDTSDVFKNLKDRTNVTSLNLNGQTHLTSPALNTVLTSMTGLNYLGLRNTQIATDSFVGSGSKLKGIDLYGTPITTLSNINTNATQLNELIINNSSINLTLYANIVNRCCVGYNQTVNRFAGSSADGCGLQVYSNSMANDMINTFTGSAFNMHYHSDGMITGDLDISGNSHIQTWYDCRIGSKKLTMPNQITSATVHYPSTQYVSFGANSRCTYVEYSYTENQTGLLNRITGLSNCTLLNSVYFYRVAQGTLSGLSSVDLSPIKSTTLYLKGVPNGFIGTTTSTTFNIGTGVNNLYLIGMNLINCPTFAENSTPTYVCLNSNKLSNLTNLKNVKTITELQLVNNCFTKLDDLLSFITVDTSTGKNVTALRTLNLKDNSLDGYSITNNIEILLKLRAAGLTSLTVTNNNFSENEITQLRDGAKINGVNYVGYGSGLIN